MNAKNNPQTAHALAALLSGSENILREPQTDWQILADEARRQRVAPLLYWTLSKAGKISALPEAARGALRAAYSQSWKQNQIIFNELELLAREFERARIPVVVLKGACFALTIYPDSGARPMGDLDLLVPASNLSAAVEIAKSLGYRDDLPDASPGLREVLNHEIFLQKKGAATVALELHRSLVADRTYKYAVPVDWFWSQTRPLNHTRFPALLMLTPVAQILYASAHAMLQHGGSSAPLCWYADLNFLVRFYAAEVDWDLLLSQARVFAWGSALAAALEQTQAYFNAPLPDRVRQALAGVTDENQSMVAALKKRPATHVLEEYQKLRRLNLYGKFRLLLALVFPGPAYMRWRYQLKTAWLLPVYYPLRWLGILADGARTVFALVSKKRNPKS